MILRVFCFTVHFYSPKAYEYIRAFFNLNLSHIRTIRNWYSAIKCSPGFTESALNRLKQKADEAKAKGESLNVCLIHDDMSIRQHSQWSSGEKAFIGHINAGKPEVHDTCSPLAKNAYVLMVSGIGEESKITIGYFLVQGLCAAERAAILYEAIFKLHSIGVVVSAINNDDHPTNIAAAKILGGNYDEDQPYFKNPFDDTKMIYALLDPPHMIKLARNCLGNKVTIYYGKNEPIEWSYFQNLVQLQLSENVNFGNKLTKSHLEYWKVKMNVRLATQTLSNSTAASIEYLNTVMNNEQFRGSESTVEYIRFCNYIFDIMNTKRNHCEDKNKYKQSISDTDIDEISSYFEYAKKYIERLHIVEEGKKKCMLKKMYVL